MKALFLSIIFILSAGTLQAAGDELVCSFICAYNDGEPIGIGDADIQVDCDQNNNPGATANTPTEDCYFEAAQACAAELNVDDYENVQVESLGCRPQPPGEKKLSRHSMTLPQNIR